MDIVITLQYTLSDNLWGFSDLLEGKPLSVAGVKKIIDLISEEYLLIEGSDAVTVREKNSPSGFTLTRLDYKKLNQ